jgi:large subunit ribosomal protein L10
MIAAEYSGLSVAQLQDLRRRIAEDATFSIVKNTLARRAVEAAGREEMLQYLQGPIGVVWVQGDAARAAKALSEFAKESDDLFAPKGGLLDGEPLDTGQLAALAKLPPREELIAKLAGGLAAPLFALAGLSQPLSKLALGLDQIRAQMPAEPEAAPAEEPAAEAAPEPEAPPEEAAAEPEGEPPPEEAQPAEPEAESAEPAD